MSKLTNLSTKLTKLGMNSLTTIAKQIIDASTKVVEIQLEKNVVEELKKNKYKMCFAKKVGNAAYNVVWEAYEEFLRYNEFSWVPLYQIFGTNTFKETIKVKADTNAVSIGLGEIVELDKYGNISDSTTGGDKVSLNLNNEYGEIHVGVNQLSTGIDGKEVSNPIYVSPQQIMIGEVHLQPKEMVMVWFEQNIETSTIFSTARTRAIELDLTEKNSVTIEYDMDEGWKLV